MHIKNKTSKEDKNLEMLLKNPAELFTLGTRDSFSYVVLKVILKNKTVRRNNTIRKTKKLLYLEMNNNSKLKSYSAGKKFGIPAAFVTYQVLSTAACYGIYKYFK